MIYLRREDHREGYPMEEDSGEVGRASLFRPRDKSFILAHGLGLVYKPGKREYEVPNPAARRVSPYAGAPIEPTGNPLVDGVGPASWVQPPRCPRHDVGGQRPRSCRWSTATASRSRGRTARPIGMPVFGCDDRMAGVCTNVWVDQSERLIRYFEVRTMGDAGARASVTVPMAMAQVNQRRGTIKVDAVRADQFAAPRRSPARARSPGSRKRKSSAISAAATSTPSARATSRSCERVRQRADPRPAGAAAGGRVHRLAGFAGVAPLAGAAFHTHLVAGYFAVLVGWALLNVATGHARRRPRCAASR